LSLPLTVATWTTALSLLWADAPPDFPGWIAPLSAAISAFEGESLAKKYRARDKQNTGTGTPPAPSRMAREARRSCNFDSPN
jgi:hypothetical protein